MKVKIFKQLRFVFGWIFFWFNEEDDEEDEHEDKEDVNIVYEFVFFLSKKYLIK